MTPGEIKIYEAIISVKSELATAMEKLSQQAVKLENHSKDIRGLNMYKDITTGMMRLLIWIGGGGGILGICAFLYQVLKH